MAGWLYNNSWGTMNLCAQPVRSCATTTVMLLSCMVLSFAGCTGSDPAAVTSPAVMSNKFGSQLTFDGAGGAIIVWGDLRSNSDHDIYAQGITPSGRQ